MPSPRRRPWGSLNQETIVSTALDLVRREGLDALSVRRLAAELGASRMALYRHVPDKQALIDLIGNRFTESELVPVRAREGPWQDRLRALAATVRRHLHTHPGLIDLLLRHGVTSPGRLALVEAILDALGESGLDDARVARYYLVFVDLVVGRTHRELTLDPVRPELYTGVLAAARERDDLPHLRRAAAQLPNIDPAEVFDTELDMLILAVERASAGRGGR